MSVFPRKAILKEHEVVPVEDVREWAEGYERADRTVCNDYILVDDLQVRVSTVFLGLNHQFGSGPPLWFETAIFGGQHDGYRERHSTWNDAVEGHARAVAVAVGGGDFVSWSVETRLS